MDEAKTMSQEIASAAVKIAPSVGLATWSWMQLPWGTIAAISGTIYSLLMIFLLIYDRVKDKK